MQKNMKNILFYPSYGITIYKTADANDPAPLISEEIVEIAELFPLKYGYYDKSIITAVHIIL